MTPLLIKTWTVFPVNLVVLRERGAIFNCLFLRLDLLLWTWSLTEKSLPWSSIQTADRTNRRPSSPTICNLSFDVRENIFFDHYFSLIWTKPTHCLDYYSQRNRLIFSLRHLWHHVSQIKIVSEKPGQQIRKVKPDFSNNI